MAKFNSTKNKFSISWNSSENTTNDTTKAENNETINNNTLSRGKESDTFFGKIKDFSSGWVNFNYKTNKDLYYLFKITLSNVPNQYINSLQYDILFRGESNKFSFYTNYINKGFVINIINISDTRSNIIINGQIRVQGNTDLVGLQTKMILKLMIPIELSY